MVDIYSTKILIRYREFYYIYFITSIISSPLCFINLQWGTYSINVTKDYTYANIKLPLTCTIYKPLFIIPSIMCNNANNTKDFNIQCSGNNTTSISFVVRCLSSTRDEFTFQWFLVSK